MTPEYVLGDWNIQVFQVPTHGEEPTEAMIEWLHDNPLEWDGDEFGIAIHVDNSGVGAEAGTEVAEPGDHVIRFSHKEISGSPIYRASGGNLAQAIVEGPFVAPRVETRFPTNFDRLQTEVNTWAQETFAESSVLRVMIRGNKEMAELLSAIAHEKDSAHVAEECADVLFFLCQVCSRAGHSLEAELRKKLEINKKRSWAKGKDGSFQHVEEVPVHVFGENIHG